MEHDNSGHDDPATSLFARGRSKEVRSSCYSIGMSRSKSRHRKGRCCYCKRERHWKAKYPKLKELKEKKFDTGNVATIVEDANNVLSISTTLVGDAWIIDSGCSYHMCSNQDWFSSY